MKRLQTILLVEDDVVDKMLVQRALSDLAIECKLEVVSNGEAALEYLRDSQHRRPDLVLLDLNMPRLNGIEFLEIVKHDPLLRCLPVVVLTTSREDSDKKASFEKGAAGYIVKPAEYEQFVAAMAVLRNYWTLSELPS